MLFMVIEVFKPGRGDEVGARFKTQGRMMPAGVAYLGSWLEPISGKCFQVMEAPARGPIDAWIGNWSDLVDFEVIPVVTSDEYWKMQERKASTHMS